MISALRKIEGRGELEGATSAVMEMCVDNPRQEFGDLFDTHPPVDKRIEALIKFAGGHDPGPIALPAPGEEPPSGGPWEAPPQATPGGGALGDSGPGAVQNTDKPFLPDRPPVELGGNRPPDPQGPAPDGPWSHKN
jgi:heat shock protein HtpX